MSYFENVPKCGKAALAFRDITSQLPWITVSKFIFRKRQVEEAAFSGNKIKTIR